MEFVMKPVDPDELPPGHKGPPPKVRVLEVVEQTDGSSPVSVKKGQSVLVRVEYAALLTEGTFTAMLMIQGDTWDTIEVPLSLFLAEVITVASDTLTIAQGHQASIPFRVTSFMGPEIDVTYEMSTTQLHTGLTLLPNGYHLNSKETKSFSLIFQAVRDAPLGFNEVAIVQDAFRPLGLFFKVNIVHPQIIVNPAQPNNIVSHGKDKTINIQISISLSDGSATSVDFSHGNLPDDVSIQSISPFVESDTIVSLRLFLGNNAPNAFQFSIGWSAYNGEQTGAMDFNVAIVTESLIFNSGPETAPAAFGGWSKLSLNSEGFWTFKGHVHDSGFFDYYYASLMILNPHNPSGEVRVFQKNGSVTGTGNPFGSRDDDWNGTEFSNHGQDPFIAENWDLIKANLNDAVHWKLHVSGEVFDVLEVVLEPELLLIGAVKYAIENITNRGDGPSKPSDCQDVYSEENHSMVPVCQGH